MTDETPKDFFISYTGSDKAWAEWIGWHLEANGYTVVIQAWDFRPGNNFVSKMHTGLSDTQRLIAVLSPEYLNSGFAGSEWMAAFARDPLGNDRKLIPIRVAKCDPKGLLPTIVYADFVGHDEATCRTVLLSAVAEGRQKPASPPAFPGGTSAPTPQQKEATPPFPGSLPSNWQAPPRNSVFTGRETILENLHERLTTDAIAALNQIQAISGLGGVGKTQTVLEYASLCVYNR
ncbi:MAG: toll/interleukin-1 receptor domain-containing protein [Capsulimonas sp.]|uniref:toll/interleukin-1 receptor domain-containing protein n=1 Tax=Capsulimonas sp. TaxID=2494211 RepID=UPI0032674E41